MNRCDPEVPGPLPRHDGEALFDAPWQAETLALAHVLQERGLFTGEAWACALGGEHRRLLDEGRPDVPDTYYQAALAALESLVAHGPILTQAGLSARVEEWRRAYLNTPHGKPVHLSAAKANA